jgi:Tfp pilus assembly protein PilN
VVTKEKAKGADEILATSVDHRNILSQLSELLPQNVYFIDFKLTQGKFIITGKARSSADMAGFVSSLTSSKGAEIISGVNIDNLTSDESGQYDFGLSAALVQKKN